MATMTVILGEPPYGKERAYTTLRFVLAAMHEGHEINLFLMEDAVFLAKKGQKPADMPAVLDERMPSGEALLKAAIDKGVKVKICGVCARERALEQEELIPGATIGSMQNLVQWIAQTDRVVTF